MNNTSGVDPLIEPLGGRRRGAVHEPHQKCCDNEIIHDVLLCRKVTFMVTPSGEECNSDTRCAIGVGVRKPVKKASTPRPRRPPPLHQGTLEEAIERLGLRQVTTKRMFGGLCYYADNKPFAILLGEDFALKLPAAKLREGCTQGDGRIFNPGGGDFLMHEYITLSNQVLMDETRIDTYVLASHRFIAGQGGNEREGLDYADLLRGRDGLYRRKT